MSISGNMRKNKIADEEMGEGDFGWSWLIRGFGVIIPAPQNICYISGKIDDEQHIEGVL